MAVYEVEVEYEVVTTEYRTFEVEADSEEEAEELAEAELDWEEEIISIVKIEED